MKFYESHYEEYINSVEKYNMHPELIETYAKFPKRISQLENLIIYGPPGVGKYSQVLYLLKKYSPSELKYDKKIVATTEKQQYVYRISDIHYEIDMSLLGCNSKLVWHEVFNQIVDIISVKQDKLGIIVCKNFHMIHSELLEIFYSYMQRLPQVNIKFIILTEHISFFPNNILNACAIIPIKKPIKSQLTELCINKMPHINNKTNYFNTEASIDSKQHSDKKEESFIKRISGGRQKSIKTDILTDIDTNLLLNMKEISSFDLVNSTEELPIDVFNTICDQIIHDIDNIDNIPFTEFRDSLYDIMIYNLDVVECVWYILTHFIHLNRIKKEDCSMILEKIFPFLQYFNNNYRPIYHLENIMFYIINILKNE